MSPPEIDPKELTPIVAEALNESVDEVLDWEVQEIQGGTVGEVHLVEGHARTWEMEIRPWSLVLKIQRKWARWGDPESWRREMWLYQSDLYETLPATLRVPSCFHVFERSESEIWMWLEKVGGKSGKEMSTTDYGLAARHLGHFQGRFLVDRELPQDSRLSTRRWVAKTLADWSTEAFVWLEQIREESSSAFPKDLVEDTLRLWTDRDRFLDVVDGLPRTLCHRDFNPANLFVDQEAGLTYAIDWDCAGIGALGEDIADLVGEALVFEDFDPTQIEELKEIVLSEYLSGLREAGWEWEYRDLLVSYDVHSSLQWCFRIPWRVKDGKEPEKQEQYRRAQRYMLDLANEARDLIG